MHSFQPWNTPFFHVILIYSIPTLPFIMKTHFLTSELPETTLGLYIRDLRMQKRIALRTFAKKLAELSQQRGNSELSNTNKFSPGFLSDIENGRRYPSEQVLELIAEVLDITVEDLHNNDHRMPTEDLQRLHAINPLFGFAFRRAVNFIKSEKLTPQEVLQRLSNDPQNNNKNEQDTRNE